MNTSSKNNTNVGIETYSIYKQDEYNPPDAEDTDYIIDFVLIGDFTTIETCAKAVLRIPQDDLWLYSVTEWYTTAKNLHDSDKWQYLANTDAKDWLTDFLTLHPDTLP